MIKSVKKNGYYIPMSGDPRLHEELAWFATDDDLVIGVVIRDRIDDDFSWVVMIEVPRGQGYSCIDCATSLPSQEAAKEGLHVAMKRAHVQTHFP